MPEKPLRSYYIITNRTKDPDGACTDRICRCLRAKGCTCLVREDERLIAEGTGDAVIPDGVECALVLGGDGTLLQASRSLSGCDLPLLGINLGTLGYLAEVEMQHVEDALDRLAEGAYYIEDRMMLRGRVFRGEQKLTEDEALNDIVVTRRGPLRIVDFTVYVNGTFLCSYRADGIIVSTATGSTGYSLSAGGPIVSPDADLMLLTAIAPHTLSSRSVILPDNVEITVEMGGSDPDRDVAEATFDGNMALQVQPGDRIRIVKAERRTRLIRISHQSFVEVTRSKMN